MGLSTANLISGVKKASCFLLVLMLVCSCKKEEKATSILSKEEMVAIMVNVYLAEARLNSSLIVRDSARQIFKPYEDKLLLEKGIQDSVLKKSYLYYLEHTKELEQIYDVVIDTLALREQKANTKPPTASSN
jgi:Domain of unknown function (DUF4296)